MIGKNSFTSNSMECLQTIQGETVKGVIKSLEGDSDYVLFVFESGYSLTMKIKENGSFWINDKRTTCGIIQKELSKVDYQKKLKDYLEALAK